MMSQDSASFDDLIGRLKKGDDQAETEIFNRFAQRLIALARSRLNPAVRQKVDPEDVVLSAYKSFFTRFADGRMELQSWDSLWGMLTIITLRKCGKQIDYFNAARRSLQRERTPQSSSDDSSYHALRHT